MATVTKPIALDESINTTESSSRNIADVLAQELSGIASAITGGDDKANKTDIATVESGSTASRAYSVGELVYVNGNLYKVKTAISQGSSFTVGTNIELTNVSERINDMSAKDVSYGSGTVEDALDELKDMTTSDGMHNATAETGITVREYIRWWKIGEMVIVDIGGISTNVSGGNVLIMQDLPIMRSRPTAVLRSDASQDTALVYGIMGTSQLRFSGGYSLNTSYYGQVIYMTD